MRITRLIVGLLWLIAIVGISGACSPQVAKAEAIKLEAKLGTPKVLAGRAGRAYLKVDLRGREIPRKGDRAPINVSFVIDRSGSMSGEKLERAKEATIAALRRLKPSDTISVVVYGTDVYTIVPATRLGDGRRAIRSVRKIHSQGDTALFAGVSRGARELRRFKSDRRVNRVILLSDGLANVGPSSPGELAELGQSLAREGISVTTFGLGLQYNEDLMTQLAMASDGNHAFIESASELATVFDREFGDIFAVVGQEVHIDVYCKGPVKIRRLMGRSGSVTKNHAHVRLNQVYGGQEKYLLFELDVPSLDRQEKLKVADVHLRYRDIKSSKTSKIYRAPMLSTTQSQSEVSKYKDREVLVAAAEMRANEENKRAIALRTAGKVKEAKKVLQQNSAYLDRKAKEYKSPKLRTSRRKTQANQKALDNKDWGRTRKRMRKEVHELDNQQSY